MGLLGHWEIRIAPKPKEKTKIRVNNSKIKLPLCSEKERDWDYMHSWPDIKLPCLHMFGFHTSFSSQLVFLQSLNKRALSPHYTPEF